MQLPDPEEEFIAEVDRISGSGNGIIQPGDRSSKHINLGKISKSLVGEKIVAKMGKDRHAQLKRKIDTESIAQELRNVSVILLTDGIQFSNPEGTAQDNENQTRNASVTHSSSESNNDELSSEEGESSGETQKGRKDFTKNLPETVTTQTQQYKRSSEVRRHVKERADGFCEGCGKPAPFISKTGEPYLHAHHIHELSDGGTDTPGTVIALCPNCHYKVHHGKEGEEFNQELSKTLRKIEGINKE